MNARRATIYEVAAEAGVSIGTVSRVMNGKDRVAPATRARVQAAAEKLDFHPNPTARGLATQRTGTLMLLVSDIGNFYFAEMAKHVSRLARDQGYRLVLGDSDETVDREGEYLRTLGDGHVDGAIVAPLTTDANRHLFDALRRDGFPLVLMDTELEGLSVSSVRVDNERGGRLAVEHLAGKGHRRIAFLSGNIEFQTNRMRYNGFRDEMNRRGLPLRNDFLVLNQDFLQAERFCGVDALLGLAEPPTAIFATSDLTAMACIRKVLASGRRVPEDIAVVGFDDLLMASTLELPLTTVQQPKARIARKAVELLMEQIGGGPGASRAEHVLIEPTLVVRESA